MVRRIGLLAMLAVMLVGCGAESRGSEATSPPSADTGLLFQRTDGSRVEMHGRPLVWCGPWNDVIPDHTLHVAAVGGVERKPGQDWFTYWELWAIPEDVEGGAAVGFPGDYTFDDPSGVVLFVGDRETKNEASSKGEDSGGQIVFTKASCEVGAPVEFTIDAVVDSEFSDGDPLKVEGAFRGVVGPGPESYDSN